MRKLHNIAEQRRTEELSFCSKDNVKMIFAGPLQYHNDTGGAVVLFQDLIKTVGSKSGIFDTNARNYTCSLLMVFRFTWCCVLAALRKQELALHGSNRDYRYLGSIILLCHLFLGLKYHTRKFAGNFDVFYKKMPLFWRWTTSRFLMRSRQNFFETKHLVQCFSTFHSKTLWFPNYRSASDYLTSPIFNGKFVFMGQVKKEKGIDRLLSLAPLLPSGWKIDVFGPLVDYRQEDFQGNISYCGRLNQNQVCKTLANYSVLLLLSYREGYPGVIIEAYSVGLPVMVCNLPSLCEIVDRGSGAVVECLEKDGFLKAIKEVAEGYQKKRVGARERFEAFERTSVLKKYLSEIRWAEGESI